MRKKLKVSERRWNLTWQLVVLGCCTPRQTRGKLRVAHNARPRTHYQYAIGCEWFRNPQEANTLPPVPPPTHLYPDDGDRLAAANNCTVLQPSYPTAPTQRGLFALCSWHTAPCLRHASSRPPPAHLYLDEGDRLAAVVDVANHRQHQRQTSDVGGCQALQGGGRGRLQWSLPSYG